MNGHIIDHSIHRLNHDIRNIIETIDFQYRMKNTNNEYRQVFHFFDNDWDYRKCPNPHGRCVTKYIDVKIYWFDGKRHRKDGPAIELSTGTKQWYYNNLLHRMDGPAVEHTNGDKWWYLNDQLHREDGPAIEYTDGYKAWYVHNQLHREDGPAIEYADGSSPNEYWEYGKMVK